MQIVILFIVVFVCLAATTALGFSVESKLVGAIIGAGAYILISK